MTTPILRPTASVEIDGDQFSIVDGTITLDSGAVPYATATLELPLLDDSIIEYLDARELIRCPIEAGDVTITPRRFDLGLRSREVDHSAKKVILELASDEAMLMDYAPLADDPTPRTYENSLRAVAEYVLGKLPGITRNLILAPRGTSLSGWSGTVGSGTAPTMSTSSTPGMNVGGLGIDTFIRAEAVGAGVHIDIRNGSTQGILTGAGSDVTASAYLRPSSIAGVTGNLYIQFVDSGGVTISTATSPTLTLTAGAWTRVSLTATAPAGTVWARSIFRAFGTIVAGSRLDVTAILVEESSHLGPYKDKILVTPGTDAVVTAYWPLENLILNPSVVGSVTGFLTASGGTVISYNSGAGVDGAAGFLRAAQSAATGGVWAAPSTADGYRVEPGRDYVLSTYSRASVAGALLDLRVIWQNTDGATIRQDVSATSALGTSWARYNFKATAPPGAVRALPWFAIAGSASGRTWDLDRMMFTPGAELVDFFDGSTVPSGYTTAWVAAANQSTSLRTPIVERLPESFIWKAGQTAWDFLVTLTASVNMVLWCDEVRAWYLKTPESRTIPQQINVSGLTARTGTDTISRDDEDAYVTGVVLRYTWTDSDDIVRVAVDAAGSPEKVLYREFSKAYPGPGVAAAMLARRQGTGRVQTADSISDWATTPGMSVKFSLPGAPDVTGRVVSVDFDLRDGFMRIGAGGLVDIIPGSISALVGTIDSLVGTIDSL